MIRMDYEVLLYSPSDSATMQGYLGVTEQTAGVFKGKADATTHGRSMILRPFRVNGMHDKSTLGWPSSVNVQRATNGGSGQS